MGQKEKLIQRLLSIPADFSFEEAVRLLGYLGFSSQNKGKTSGSRVLFIQKEKGIKIILHKPHGRKALLEYQVRQIAELLKQEGLL